MNKIRFNTFGRVSEKLDIKPVDLENFSHENYFRKRGLRDFDLVRTRRPDYGVYMVLISERFVNYVCNSLLDFGDGAIIYFSTDNPDTTQQHYLCLSNYPDNLEYPSCHDFGIAKIYRSAKLPFEEPSSRIELIKIACVANIMSLLRSSGYRLIASR